MFAAVFASIPMVHAQYSTFDQYGPKMNMLLIKLYANENAEFGEFEQGKLDMVDWPLTKYWIERWSSPPYSNDILMQDYGGEIGMYEFDINNNITKRVSLITGADPGPDGQYGTMDDPQEPNIGYNSAFRHAIATLSDRSYIVSTIMQGFGTPAYTMVPPALGAWVNTAVDQHPYNPALAADILARGEDGILGTADDIDDNNGDGYYDWPGTTTQIEVDFCLRTDHTPGRKEAGERLVWELTQNLEANGGHKFNVPVFPAMGSIPARAWVTEGKSFTIYTGGWSLRRDPDFLFTLYHSSMYWDPGRPPNYCNINDPELDAYLYAIYGADNLYDVAMTYTQAAQECMTREGNTFNVALWAANAPKAVHKQYTGGTNEVPAGDWEDAYRGKDWKGFANEAGKGLNSWFSTLGAYVESSPGVPMDGGVLRYGFKINELNALNPIYSDSYWEWEVLGRVYESFSAVNPYNLAEDLEWVAKRWEVGVWVNPDTGQNATRLRFELRDDVYWHDGQKLDADDVKFTMVDLVDILELRGLPPPWYYSNLLDVNSVDIINQYKVEIKMNIKSYFALHWIGGNIILPEHVWRPIVTSGDPETFAPDPQITGCGPYKAYPHSIDKDAGDYYVPTQYVKLDANEGYFNKHPIRVSIAVHGSYIDAYLQNYHGTAITATVSATSDGSPLTGGGTVTVPARPGIGIGGIPGVLIVHFSGLSPPTASHNIVVTLGYTFGGQAISDTFSRQVLAPSFDGDITNDGNVDIRDFVHLSFHFGLEAYVWPEDDCNADKAINVLDAVIVENHFGNCTTGKFPVPPGPAEVYINPVWTGPGDFSVDVMIANVSNLYGYDFKVFFDPGVLWATNLVIGDFLPSPPNTNVRKVIGSNFVWLSVSRYYGWGYGVYGSGRLATIDFTVIGTGECYLDLADTLLVDPVSDSINHVALDGYFSNLPQSTFLADLVKRKSTNRAEIKNFRISRDGTTQTLYGEVENLGTSPVMARVKFEPFDEAGLPGGDTMYSATVLLQPGQSMVLTTAMPIDSSMIGYKWSVTNSCEFDNDGDGAADTVGANKMSYDFTVRA